MPMPPDIERAAAWMMAQAKAGVPEANTAIRVWSGFLHEFDAWHAKFPGYRFDPQTETIQPE